MDFLHSIAPALHGIFYVLLGIQLITAVLLILIIAIQTTKSEQSGAGLGGWGTIGGQASSSINKFGLDAQITRVTTWIAVTFFAVSFLSALAHAWIQQAK